MTEIGKIQTASTRLAYCDVEDTLKEGDLVTFQIDGGDIRARVAYLQTGLKGRNIAHIEYLDPTPKVPGRGTVLHKHRGVGPGGLEFSLGSDVAKAMVPLRLNQLFRHILLAGMTQQGKTHLELAIIEQVATWKVPILLVDSQGEFRHLPTTIGDRVHVVTEASEAIGHLRKGHLVLLDLVDDNIQDRKEKVAHVLRELFETQERASANGKPHKPVLIILDEADTFAPKGIQKDDACRDAIIEVAKRGSKLGLGLLCTTTRPGSLHVDVRSQLNGAFFFKLVDTPSHQAMKQYGLGRYDIEVVARLGVGECVVAGHLVPNPVRIRVRRIETPRTRSTDFESMLQVGA